MQAVRIITLIVAMLVGGLLIFSGYLEYNLTHTLLGMAWGAFITLSVSWAVKNRGPGKVKISNG